MAGQKISPDVARVSCCYGAKEVCVCVWGGVLAFLTHSLSGNGIAEGLRSLMPGLRANTSLATLRWVGLCGPWLQYFVFIKQIVFRFRAFFFFKSDSHANRNVMFANFFVIMVIDH